MKFRYEVPCLLKTRIVFAFLYGESEEPIEIFGKGGGEQLSKESGTPLVGTLPIDLDLKQGGDSGVPLMVSAPQSAMAGIFQEMVQEIVDLQ